MAQGTGRCHENPRKCKEKGTEPGQHLPVVTFPARGWGEAGHPAGSYKPRPREAEAEGQLELSLSGFSKYK